METSGKITKLASSNQQEEFELRRRIADGSQDPGDYCKLADLLIDAGRYEDAVALYQRALNLPLTNLQKARVSTELGWIFYEVGPQEEALKLAQTAIAFLSQEQESPEVLAYRGASQSLIAHCVWSSDAKSGEEAARLALSWLKRLMIEAPDFEEMAAAYYDAARLQNLLGNAREAVVLCENCLQYEMRKRERLSCLSIYGEALRQEGRFEEAEQTLEKIVQDVNADKGALANLYFSLGLIRRSTNRLAEARETFEQALGTLRADPYLHDDPHFLTQIHWNLGELYYQSGDLAKALEAFQQILAYNPEDNIDHRNALLWVGYCYQAMRDSSKATDYFREVSASPQASETEKVSARKRLAWNLGKLHYDSGDYRQAAAAFEEVLTYHSPDDLERPDTLVWLGQCYLATGAPGKARECFEEVLASIHAPDADKASALAGVGDLYLEGGKDKEAAAAFKEALIYQPESDSNHWNTMLKLGHAYFGRDYQKARECYESVLTSPHAPEADKASARRNISRSLANLYYEAGQYEEAAAAFKEVLSYYPEDVPHHHTALLWLGRCCDATRDYEKARACYEEVLASPHAPEADKASAQEGLSRLPPSPKKTLH